MARLVRRGADRAGPVAPVSWPGLCRPSTAFAVSAPPVVGGRARPGHATRAATASSAQSAPMQTRSVSAYADRPGHGDLGETSPLAKGRPNLPAACCSTTAGLYAACVVFVGANGRAGRVADVSVAMPGQFNALYYRPL